SPALAAARAAIVLASAAEGLQPPLDAPWLRIQDLDGLRTFAQQARDDGFGGMLLIHPSHVETVNQVFSPTADEVTWARGIVASTGEAAAAGRGAYAGEGQMRHGTESQKRRYLPEIAAGRLRLQSMAVTEPEAGSDTSRITTFARKEADGYVVNGQKVFTSRVQHSDLLLLLARTQRAEEVARKTDGMSLFLIDLRQAGSAIEIRPIETMVNHETNALFISDLHLPADALAGDEGAGFRQVLDGLNAERILIASESIGDARWFVERSVTYARERIVFGQPIGANQGVQFPIARAFMRHGRISMTDNARGRFFEDFTVGDLYRHRLGRTLSEADNTWFTLLTCNTNEIHFNADYAAHTEFGRPLMNSCLTLSLVTGL